ncbi:hypothetical protein PV729_38265 [Streptomyces europaeiscabiei]|uniref:Uncharacterized protein n=1 Tax=Streptomyces europaeiscabiei TaxID=146819 RepID=A0ABU4NL06_9ACTN|nr:hypothetical protein [Streptomyces europaeiscabiei]MDX3546192.1 hypothetical protein [Streptomyces europaeiscabiei]MDX3557502.1 hypothetical protein [Streptomyces europaeiscabiei]MDX3703591.1 hypothetical protein [Streptomyces europaeiscabiei]
MRRLLAWVPVDDLTQRARSWSRSRRHRSHRPGQERQFHHQPQDDEAGATGSTAKAQVRDPAH